ncbi:hypothetical protein XA68_12806 [Ophiocordyceps unilateralis]|uniref:Uncharacterized protein n=1 Tax=Ophiocordyceps unilateralis TaxID=268505 RepID=A0A2A9PDK2_OPHUN|nr:hypothetical protein XA68_12806 [Ophiocordyceps unilateralis]
MAHLMTPLQGFLNGCRAVIRGIRGSEEGVFGFCYHGTNTKRRRWAVEEVGKPNITINYSQLMQPPFSRPKYA